MTICSTAEKFARRISSEQKTFSIKRITSSEKTLPIKGHGMIIVHHLGQSSQDSRNLSRCQIARGRSPSESLGALDMNFSNEDGTIKQTSSGIATTQHYRQ